MTVYSATKAALSSFSTGLRMELRGTGVDVLVVAPGSTDTKFFSDGANVDATASGLAETSYPPQRVARQVVKSSRKRRREVTLTADGRAITFVRRISHRVADGIMYRYGKKATPKLDSAD